MDLFQRMLPQLIQERMDSGERTQDGCLIWGGYIDKKNGYGQLVTPEGNRYRAHRLVYEHCVGPIPDRMVIDHLCRNRACVEPTHLEPVTHRENTLRGAGRGGAFYEGGCQDPAHTQFREANGHLRCRECTRAYQREYQREYRKTEKFKEYRREYRQRKKEEG